MSQTRYSRPALEDLDDYVSGYMPESDVIVFEELLFARAADAVPRETVELVFHDQLAQLVTWVSERGGFAIGTTHEVVDALRRNPQLKVHYVEIPGHGITEIPPLPPGTHLYAYRIGVDLRGYDQVDVVVETLEGLHIKTFREISYDPSDGATYGVCEAPLAELSFMRGPVVSKFMAARGSEEPKLVATVETHPLPG